MHLSAVRKIVIITKKGSMEKMKRNKNKILVISLLITMLFSTAVSAVKNSTDNFKKTRNYENQFADVKNSEWYASSVSQAYEYGLVSGNSETSYNPTGNVSVAETIALACRLNNIYSGNNTNFESTDLWYQPYVDYAVKNKIIDKAYTNFEAPATRLEFATILSNSLPNDVFAPINNISNIPDVESNESNIYMLYNAGILTGNDKYGTFNPTSNIQRSEVAAIIVRIADKTQRKQFTLNPKPVDVESTALMEFSGHGDKVINNINIPYGSYYAELSHNGDRNFISKLYYGEKSYDYFSLSNEIGACSLQVALYDNGNAAVKNGMLEVKADGDWKISIKPVSGTTTTNIKGCGKIVTGIFTATSSRATVNLTHTGEHNFIAKVIKYNGTKSYDYESLANEIGNYNGQKIVNLTPGERYYFYVRADGEWTIDMGLGDDLTEYILPRFSESNNKITIIPNINDDDYEEVDDYTYTVKNGNPYDILADYVKENGNKTSSGSYITVYSSSGLTYIIVRNDDSIGLVSTSDKVDISIVLEENDDNFAVITVETALGYDYNLMTNFSEETGKAYVIGGNMPKQIHENALKALGATLKLFDTFLKYKSVGVTLSDFGIKY